MKISVIVPVCNEQNNIPKLVQMLKAVLDQVANEYLLLFVNDNSKSNSLQTIK